MAVQPKVAVMNNGPRKGGPASTFETLRKSPGFEDIWQGHLALGTAKEINTDEKMIANLEPSAECKGNLLKLSVAPDGKYTMTNARTGFSKTYASKSSPDTNGGSFRTLRGMSPFHPRSSSTIDRVPGFQRTDAVPFNVARSSLPASSPRHPVNTGEASPRPWR